MREKYIKCGDKRISLNVIEIVVVTLFFAFQRQMNLVSNVFENFDELFAIFVFLKIGFLIIKGSCVFTRQDNKIFALMLIVLFIGLFGNIFFGILNDPFMITVDVISIFKVLIAYFWIRSDWDLIIHILASIVRFLILVMLICCLASYMGIYKGMLGEVRYGISSYIFLFNVAGNYGKWFYFAIPLLSADLYYSKNIRKYIYIIIAMVLWLTTLRSRAFALVTCYAVFSIWFFKIKKQSRNKTHIVNILPMSMIAIIMCWQQLVFYFTDATQARANLLKYSIVTAKEYFPFGAGFGTYGSDVAATTYSNLYTIYGFKSIYGMGRVHTRFLNDNYWPMIIGQFGVFGVAAMALILYSIYKQCISYVKKNKYFFFATICSIFFLLASSLASKSYSEYTSIAVFLVHGILVQREIANNRDEMCGCMSEKK